MKKLLALLITMLLSCSVNAQSVEYYYFADSAIGMLSDMRDSTILPSRKANMQGKDLLKFFLDNAVRTDKVCRNVMARLKKFEKSNDKGIQQAATLFSSGILSVQIANGSLSDYLEMLLNDPKLMLQEGSVSRKMAELSEDGDTAWQAYAQTAGLVTYSLIDGIPRSLKDIEDPKKMQQKLSKLLINKSEIELLKAHLQRSFGPVLVDNSKARLADLPAISMWHFLNDKWIPAADK